MIKYAKKEGVMNFSFIFSQENLEVSDILLERERERERERESLTRVI
jgi:hypothetical protein